MSEYPNSIRNNMVNTIPFRENDYNIQVSSLPEPNCSYEPQRGVNFKTIIIVAAIAVAAFGGVTYEGYLQHKSMLENTAVEQVVPMPGDAKLMVTANPLYSYIETPDGLHVSEYNGMKASDWAQPYVEEAQKNAKQM